jgi:predicted O-linked N-acetylglucosamine transferase (SPINDLY family)
MLGQTETQPAGISPRTIMTSAKFVNELIALHGAGRIADMEARARAHVRSQPSSPILNELLGIALTAQRRFAEALPFLEKAARRQPDDPQFCENLALCLRELRQYAAAESHLRRALELRPRSVEALNALGSVLRELHREDEADAAFRAALAIDPAHPAANFNLGKLLLTRMPEEAAKPYFGRALHVSPTLMPAVQQCLSVYYAQTGQTARAIEAAHAAVSAAPSFVEAWIELAALYGDIGQFEQATKLLDHATTLIGDVREAIQSGREDVVRNLASVLATTHRHSEAVSVFRALCDHAADPEAALVAYGTARGCCEWDFAGEIEADALRAAGLDRWSMPATSAFAVLSHPASTRSDQLSAAMCQAALNSHHAVPLERRHPAQGRERLRIAYLSNDFYNHATAHLIAGVIDAHDRSRFEVIAYDHSPRTDDGYRERLKHSFDRLVPVHELSNGDAARLIADDGVDIVVDLKGWTRGNRCSILASRPAPVQMQWLGYPGTMGAPWIDYIIADPILIRAGEECDYSEKIVRLPHTYQPNDAARKMAGAPTRAEVGLPDSGIVFCSFNQAYKLTPELFSIWLDLLARVEDSVLWLLEFPSPVMDRLRNRASAAGIAPERLRFAPTRPIAEHLARTSLADVALDCFPYGAHTTASDALWAGVPFVALAGDTFASRVSSSLLTALGLPELIATSAKSYFDLAHQLATDAQMRAAVRAKISARRETAPLFDTLRFTRNLESAYAMAWERHVRGLAPDHLEIRDERD